MHPLQFLPSIPGCQCQGLFSSAPQSDPLCWSKEQNREWAMTPSPSPWVPQLTHGVISTSTITCLTWGSPTWREKGISAVPNQLSASLVTPASSVNRLKRKRYQAQPIHWNYCSRRNCYPAITQVVCFLTFFFLFFPINLSITFMLWKEKRGVEGKEDCFPDDRQKYIQDGLLEYFDPKWTLVNMWLRDTNASPDNTWVCL